VEVVDLSDEKPLIDLVRRIITGDEAGEEELVQRYQRGVAIIIDRVVHSKSVTEDLSQDAFKLILQKIRNQEVRDAERLSGFVCSVARNLAIDYVRKQRKLSSQEEIGKAEQVVDPRPDPFATLLARERAGIVRQLIKELKVPRDREVLLRTYIAEDDKAQICADLGLTRAQLNGVVSRALKRYKDLYMKRMGWPP
jgi:RNA polymerase sigma-70 factor, ECF subfamily